MKIVAIVQARMGSSRLPGKVMMNLKGRSVLSHVLDRVKAIPSVEEVIVATTSEIQDQVICDEAMRCDCSYYCGSEDDVLKRYYEAATIAKADVILRITSDCPLLDPVVCEEVMKLFLSSGSDYTSNTGIRSFPRGLDVEIFSYDSLKISYNRATEPAQREHVTPYIYQHPEIFTINSYSEGTDNSHHRWTLDTPEDWILIESIYEALYLDGSLFYLDDVLALMEQNPELIQINNHIEQKKISP